MNRKQRRANDKFFRSKEGKEFLRKQARKKRKAEALEIEQLKKEADQRLEKFSTPYSEL